MKKTILLTLLLCSVVRADWEPYCEVTYNEHSTGGSTGGYYEGGCSGSLYALSSAEAETEDGEYSEYKVAAIEVEVGYTWEGGGTSTAEFFHLQFDNYATTKAFGYAHGNGYVSIESKGEAAVSSSGSRSAQCYSDGEAHSEWDCAAASNWFSVNNFYDWADENPVAVSSGDDHYFNAEYNGGEASSYERTVYVPAGSEEVSAWIFIWTSARSESYGIENTPVFTTSSHGFSMVNWNIWLTE